MPDQLQHGILKGTEDGIPDGFIVIYDKAKHLPKITYKNQNSANVIVIPDLDINPNPKRLPMPADIKFNFTIIHFGNGKVVISDTGFVTVHKLKDIEITVMQGKIQKYPKQKKLKE